MQGQPQEQGYRENALKVLEGRIKRLRRRADAWGVVLHMAKQVELTEHEEELLWHLGCFNDRD